MSQNGYLSGVVLQIKNFQESDKLISFYSREYGKIEVLVRGCRKIKSKLAPIVSEPFALLNLKVVKGKSHYHLIGGEVKERFRDILGSYEKISQINILFLRINNLLKLKKPDSKILFLINKFLRKVSQSPQKKIQIISSAFLIKFLSFLGYRPEIKHCLVCQEKPRGKELFFDLDKGGIVCLKHNSAEDQKQEKIKISQGVLQILQKLLYKDFDFLQKENFIAVDLEIVQKVIGEFYRWHAE